ncbi:MAG: Vitamin K-dependent protein [Myxococcaceae bacterium]|nr:Vitamin K-dependent protein [Myxococcaceae bacterium]
MRRLLPLVLLASCGVPLDPEPEGQLAQRRDGIVGGYTNFDDPQVFFMEMTYSPTSVYSCSATLVGRKTLLTAAHCIAPDELGRKPTVEVTNVPRVSEATASDWIKVSRQRYHPNYRASVIQNDLGVVELERVPTLKGRQWNRANFGPEIVGKIVRVSGYGITSTDGRNSGTRRSVELPVNDLDPTLLNFGTTNQKGTCSGDSGGPMFYRFADGIERQIGVHSFHRGDCGKNADARVDKGADFIDQWFLDVEAPSCAEDGQCKSGCVPEDLDCTCAADMQCNPLCLSAAKDADCADSCSAGNVCSVTACATPDPDCQPFDAPCGIDEQCAGRRCTSDPQNLEGYCSKACALPADCPTGFECSGPGVCARLQLPVATEGHSCTPGQTWCNGARLKCGGPEGKPTQCLRACLVESDCLNTESCTARPDAGAQAGVCTPDIVLNRIKVVEYAAKSCSATGAGPAVLALLALLLRRRRRS